MNVYIRSVAERLAGQGVEVDLFTRCRGGSTHDVREIAPGIRVVSAKAGPCQPIPKSAVQRYLPEFLGGVLRVARENGNSYDLIHSHYWLSGWVGRAAKDILGVPLVASFHTLGKVKNYSLARGEIAGALRAPAGRGARDPRGRPDPRADAGGGGTARRSLRGRAGSRPDRAPGRGPSTLPAARSERGARSAAPVGAPARAVRRPPAVPQGSRRRDPHDRRGGRAAARSSRRIWSSRSSAVPAASTPVPRSLG